jgi:predicted nucleic acid-binding protein
MLADTNVIVALFDGGATTARAGARALVDEAAADGESLIVTEGVLVECVWVLMARLRLPAAEVAGLLAELLTTAPFELWDERLGTAALRLMSAESRLDIVDCLLLERSLASGEAVVTFDRLARRVGDELVEI